jgi:hypothetical protein
MCCSKHMSTCEYYDPRIVEQVVRNGKDVDAGHILSAARTS